MRNLIYLNKFTSNAQIPAIAGLVLLSALPIAAATITNELGTAGPGSWAIVTNANNPHINGPGLTNGNVAITNPGGTFNLDNPNGVNGNVVLAPGATLVNTGTITGSVSYNLSPSVLSDATAAETYFTGLSANNGLTTITGTQTINSSSPGATNIFNISNFNLGSGILTLNGDANSQFIFDITGGLSLNAGKIYLTGGLLPSDVLFNIETGDLSTSHGLNDESVITGIVLAGANSNVNMSPGQINGELISLTTGTFQIVSGGNVNTPLTPSVPEPQTYSMAGLGLLILGGMAWRRKAIRASQS